MAYTYGSVTNCKVRNGQTRDEYECRLGYEVQSQSVANNTSTVKLRLECRSISSSYTTKGSSGLTSVIDGTTVKSNASVDMSNTNTWQNFGERTITVTHNADGSYSASKSGSFTCTAGSSNYSLASGSASVTVKPATIPRASTPTLSASSVAMGSAVTITTNRKSDSFTHTLTYKFGSASGTIASGVGASTTWTPALSLANQIPNATSGTGTITCQTYNGSTLVGSKNINITLTVPSSVVPSISSIALSAGNSNVPSSWGVYVQGKSALKVVTTASGSYSSTIKSYKITGIDNNTYYSSNFTSSILQSSGTRTITVTVTDSRGRTATKTTTYTCVAYANPKITSATVTRCNSDGTANEEGTYVKYTFKASVASVNSKNTYSYKLGYKHSTDSSYAYITISNSSYTLDKSNVIISGLLFLVDYSYDFQFLVTDYFTSTSVVKSIGTGFTLMDFNASGKGMAIGKVSEKEAFEVALKTILHKQLSVYEGIEITHATPYIDFHYGNSTSDYTTRLIEEISGTLRCIGNFKANKFIGPLEGKASSATSADTATKATQDANGRNISGGYARAGTNQDNIGFDAVGSGGHLFRSGFYTITSTAGNWYNLINLRHRNGDGDGVNYGMQIRNVLASTESTLQVRQQNNGTWGNWRSIAEKPVTVYSNSSGTSGTVTLSVSADNYKYIRITYKNDDDQRGSTTFSGINNCNATIYGTIVRTTSSGQTIMLNSALFTVSGTTITISRNIQGNLVFDANGSNNSDGNKLYITKVELWN